MTKFGWMGKPTDWLDAIAKTLAFFDVETVAAWQARYGELVSSAHYRLSRLRTEVGAVAAWLRRAELQAAAIEAAQWDPDAFRETLPKIRELTRVRDPQLFVPALTDLAAGCGVAVVIVRAPRGCPASGAAQTLSTGQRLIVLSARHLSDDHLWFTFFHEAGHVLMHDASSTFVDEFESVVEQAARSEEGEADSFAEAELIGEAVVERLETMSLAPREIVRAARNASTSPGVIVGQLQHHGRLRFRTRFNELKQRYRWNGTTLERA
jgi:Zn-dependent peptidase ImmA (M78 family)